MNKTYIVCGLLICFCLLKRIIDEWSNESGSLQSFKRLYLDFESNQTQQIQELRDSLHNYEMHQQANTLMIDSIELDDEDDEWQLMKKEKKDNEDVLPVITEKYALQPQVEEDWQSFVRRIENLHVERKQTLDKVCCAKGHCIEGNRPHGSDMFSHRYKVT